MATVNPQTRKAKTEALLDGEGIPVLPSLPCVESEAEVSIRSPQDVGIRMCCLFGVSGFAFAPDDHTFCEYLREHALWEHLTPDEHALLFSSAPDRQKVVNFTWRCEALYLLMWAARLFEQLPLPRQQTDTGQIVARFPGVDESPWPFIRAIELRTKRQLLDASDLIYRLHWATRQAELKKQAPPAGLIPGVVQEWHHAINWLTCYSDQGWDDVSTDT